MCYFPVRFYTTENNICVTLRLCPFKSTLICSCQASVRHGLLLFQLHFQGSGPGAAAQGSLQLQLGAAGSGMSGWSGLGPNRSIPEGWCAVFVHCKREKITFLQNF